MRKSEHHCLPLYVYINQVTVVSKTWLIHEPSQMGSTQQTMFKQGMPQCSIRIKQKGTVLLKYSYSATHFWALVLSSGMTSNLYNILTLSLG